MRRYILVLMIILPFVMLIEEKINRGSYMNSFGSLVIKWAKVFDNGEGEDWPHGPYGSLHILLFEKDEEMPTNKDEYADNVKHIYLIGPSKGEWLDCDASFFDDLEIFQWRNQNDSINILIYESDPGWKGYDWGREHDPLFWARIKRKQSLRPIMVKSKMIMSASACESCNQRHIKVKCDCETKMMVMFHTIKKAKTFDYR